MCGWVKGHLKLVLVLRCDKGRSITVPDVAEPGLSIVAVVGVAELEWAEPVVRDPDVVDYALATAVQGVGTPGHEVAVDADPLVLAATLVPHDDGRGGTVARTHVDRVVPEGDVGGSLVELGSIGVSTTLAPVHVVDPGVLDQNVARDAEPVLTVVDVHAGQADAGLDEGGAVESAAGGFTVEDLQVGAEVAHRVEAAVAVEEHVPERDVRTSDLDAAVDSSVGHSLSRRGEGLVSVQDHQR